MARCYVELKNGKADGVLAQDETGVYAGGFDARGDFGFNLIHRPTKTWAKLPEWEDARLVSTTDPEYLDFIRRCERGTYTTTTPTEIFEIPGAAPDVIRQAFERYA
ncbi:MAG: hypothetical protein QME79_12500 [Bacillota bacterium]|nr:hypothetical protein [Bacillota bacterium]